MKKKEGEEENEVGTREQSKECTGNRVAAEPICSLMPTETAKMQCIGA